MDGQKFLSEFLEAGRATIAQDEDGFVTLTDKNGNTYVANTNESEKKRYEETKKPLSQVKKEKGEEGKKEPEEDIFKGEESEHDKFKEKQREQNPLPNEKMKKAVDEFNQRVTDKMAEFYKKSKKLNAEYYKRREAILKKYDKLDSLSVSELKDLYKEISDLSYFSRNFNDEVNNYIGETINDFIKITQSKTKNQGRRGYYLSNIKEKSPLGQFIFRSYDYIPEGVKTGRDGREGFEISSKVGHTLVRKQREMSADSAEFKEIQSLLNELDHGNNGLDLFINNVNIER